MAFGPRPTTTAGPTLTEEKGMGKGEPIGGTRIWILALVAAACGGCGGGSQDDNPGTQTSITGVWELYDTSGATKQGPYHFSVEDTAGALEAHWSCSRMHPGAGTFDGTALHLEMPPRGNGIPVVLDGTYGGSALSGDTWHASRVSQADCATEGGLCTINTTTYPMIFFSGGKCRDNAGNSLSVTSIFGTSQDIEAGAKYKINLKYTVADPGQYYLYGGGPGTSNSCVDWLSSPSGRTYVITEILSTPQDGNKLDVQIKELDAPDADAILTCEFTLDES